jgi:hypothetical protein
MAKRREVEKCVIISLLVIFMLMPISFASADFTKEGTKYQQNIVGELQTFEKLLPKDKGLLWGTAAIIVYVTEIFGTIDTPQYRPLSDVTVKIRASLSEYGGLYLFPFSKGQTGDGGCYMILWQGPCPPFLFSRSNLVIISKEGYHAYSSKPYQICRTPGGGTDERLYFTMAADGSPFTKQSNYL